MFSDKPQMQESDTEPQEPEESRDVRRRQNAAVRDRYGLGDSVTSDRFVLEKSDSEWLGMWLIRRIVQGSTRWNRLARELVPETLKRLPRGKLPEKCKGNEKA